MKAMIKKYSLLAVFALGMMVNSHAEVAKRVTPEAKIVLINPNSNAKATASMAGIAKTVVETQGIQAVVVEQTNTGVPSLLTTPQDMELAAKGVVAIGQEVAKDPDVAGIIVAAFSDPGLKELREVVPAHIPVVGIGEESFHEAAKDGQPFAIVTITPDPALLASFSDKAKSLGYDKQYLGAFVTPGEPNELLKNPKLLDKALAKAVKKAKRKGAKAVIMGGGPLSEPAVRIQSKVKIPLVVAVAAATRSVLFKNQPLNK